MNIKTLQLPLLALALALLTVFVATPTQACKKCAAHNTATEVKPEDHDHKHLDEEEGFMTILGPGHTEGWTINEEWMSIDADGVLIAGNAEKDIPKTMYAAHDKVMYNFELRAQAKAVGPEKTNGGFQFRSTFNPENGQMAGYQADMGDKYWGLLYDQSRRNKLLTKHEEGIDLKTDIKWGEWNDYRVICMNNTIEVYINGKLFSKYTEADEEIAKVKGVIGLQLHQGPASVRYYRNIRVKELE